MNKIDTPLIITAKELMKLEFPPPKWLIDDLLPEGVTVLSGAPKSESLGFHCKLL